MSQPTFQSIIVAQTPVQFSSSQLTSAPQISTSLPQPADFGTIQTQALAATDTDTTTTTAITNAVHVTGVNAATTIGADTTSISTASYAILLQLLMQLALLLLLLLLRSMMILIKMENLAEQL